MTEQEVPPHLRRLAQFVADNDVPPGPVPPATLEALLYDLNTRGPAALREPATQRRLAQMDGRQLAEIVERLLKPKFGKQPWAIAAVETLMTLHRAMAKIMADKGGDALIAAAKAQAKAERGFGQRTQNYATGEWNPPPPDPQPQLHDVPEPPPPDPQPNGKGHGPGPQGPGRAVRFRLTSFDDIELSTEPQEIIQGILPRVGLAVVWGLPKCGKSFWTFDLVMHPALGRDYRGRRVKQGTVVYLALEGGPGFRNRVVAWKRQNGPLPPGVPFHLIDIPVDLIADHAQLIADIREQLVAQTPSIVVIDTLNRALHGDENTVDMSKFIRAADFIRVTFNCLVLIIHHCGIAGTRPRGHTSLTGANDVQIAVERSEDGTITVTVEHMKDGPGGAIVASRLETLELGINDDGDPITSCVVVPVEDVIRKASRGGRPPAAAQKLLVLLRSIISEFGVPAPTNNHIPVGVKVVEMSSVRLHYEKAHPSDKPDTIRKSFVRAAEQLQDLHLIGIWDGKVWCPDIRT